MRPAHLPGLIRAMLGGTATTLLWIFVIAGTFLALRFTSPALLRLAVPLFLVAVLVWSLGFSFDPPARRVRRLLERRQFEEAFRFAIRHEEIPALREFLQHSLAVPSPGLRTRLIEAFEELVVLHGAVHDKDNTYVEAALKRAMREGSDDALAAYWNIVRNLAVVANQQVGFRDDHPKIKRIAKLLEQLQFAAADARQKLAELTLGATGEELEDAKEAFDDVRRQGEALLEVETLLG